jgi:hypothetical protein
VYNEASVPHQSRASTSVINKNSLYVRRVRFLGEEDQYKNWLDLLCAWIKSLYLVNILLMTVLNLLRQLRGGRESIVIVLKQF